MAMVMDTKLIKNHYRRMYKNNFPGYFNFYYRIVGARLLFFLGLSTMISFLDGMGLAMFIPLLQAVSEKPSGDSSQSLGQLRHFTDVIRMMGFGLNLTTVLMVLLILFVLKGLIKFVQLTYYAKLRQLFIRKVRYRLMDSLQSLPFSAFLKLDAGRIHNTLTVEVQRLFQTMTYYFNAAQASVMLLTYMALAFLANYQFAVLVGIGAAASNFIYRKIYGATRKASMELSRKAGDFNGFLTQSILHFKYLKSTNTFNRYAPKLKKVIDETEHLNRRIGNLNAITTSVKEPMIILIVVAVIFFRLNWTGASLSSMILSLLLFYRALSFLVMIQNHWQGFIENIGGMNSVAQMLDKMQEMKEIKGPVVFSQLNMGISLRHVSLSYEGRKVLDGIDLDIPKKCTIALIGESGAGKTTLANIIAGLIQPDKGEVLVDNIPMRAMNMDTYRDQVGYISQESVIFNDSIYNNITFWADPTPENMRRFNEVTAIASLTGFVNGQPEKEGSRLGDNGLLISGGQKQRISIARELFKKTEVLIFDEATSALDSETERMIRDNIEKLHGAYTMILIAHRLSTIRRADTIYLLEQGRISASGSFGEMLQKSSHFSKMVSLQAFGT
jgi:ABC-type multidrug transport system fused ATPase/permease subunit